MKCALSFAIVLYFRHLCVKKGCGRGGGGQEDKRAVGQEEG